jgi:hypothetical protein
MAEIIDVNQMLNNAYEPKRAFRWIIEIDGMDSFLAQSSGRPQLANTEIEVPYLNSQQYFAGKNKPQDMELVFTDAIAPSQTQKAWEWARLIFEPETGRSGYKAQYAKTVTLKLLSPPGEVVEKWKLINAWPKAVKPSALDYKTEDVLNVGITLKYDRALQLF